MPLLLLLVLVVAAAAACGRLVVGTGGGAAPCSGWAVGVSLSPLPCLLMQAWSMPVGACWG